MPNLPETSTWTEGVYQIERTDPVEGGPGGISNVQASQLAARTRWLRDTKLSMLRGVAAFGGAVGVVVSHGLGHADYQVCIAPLGDTGGAVGEWSVAIGAESFVVTNTGEFRGEFAWAVLCPLAQEG